LSCTKSRRVRPRGSGERFHLSGITGRATYRILLDGDCDVCHVIRWIPRNSTLIIVYVIQRVTVPWVSSLHSRRKRASRLLQMLRRSPIAYLNAESKPTREKRSHCRRLDDHVLPLSRAHRYLSGYHTVRSFSEQDLKTSTCHRPVQYSVHCFAARSLLAVSTPGCTFREALMPPVRWRNRCRTSLRCHWLYNLIGS
jgi:hypothetical protein